MKMSCALSTPLILIITIQFFIPRSIGDSNDIESDVLQSIKNYTKKVKNEGRALPMGMMGMKHKTTLPSFFTVVKFKNSACMAAGNPPRKGTCYTKNECISRKGTPMGLCAWGFGTCCIFSKTCGEKITENCTYFTNPEYDWGSSYLPEDPESCELKVVKCRPDICQIRLDFEDFDLYGIDSGVCGIDNFAVIGGSEIPGMCGENTGQHVYINVPKHSKHITLQVNVDPTLMPGFSDRYDRRWSIKVTQLECNNPNIAPPGCLQYYTQRTGKITSFNFGTDVTQTNFGYPKNMNYGVCIRKENGYCSIRYTSNQFQFGVDRNNPNAPNSGANCGLFGSPGDYVIIPNAQPQNDRFCGGEFPEEGIETTAMPYVLTVVSDNTYYGELGFMLDYHQQPC